MHKQRPLPRRSTGRQFGFSRTRKLELEVSAARSALSALRGDYLELALHASLLSRERDTALTNLKRTEDYLAFARPGFSPQRQHVEPPAGADGAGPMQAGDEPAAFVAPLFGAAAWRTPRWRKVVDAIRQHALQSGQLESDLSDLRRELAALGDEYARLQSYAGELERERDVARENLKAARNSCLSPLETGPAVVDGEPDQTPADLDQLNKLISDTERQLADSRAANLEMAARLANLDAEIDRLRSADAQEIDMLQQRIAALEPELERARGKLQTVERELDEAGGRYAQVQQQNQDLSTRLDEQGNSLAQREERLAGLQQQYEAGRAAVAGLEQQLAESRSEYAALEERNRTLTDALAQENSRTEAHAREISGLQQRQEELIGQTGTLRDSLAAAEQARLVADEQSSSLASELERRNAEFEAASTAARERADQLEQRIAGLDASLQGETAARAEAERLSRRFEHEASEERDKLAERDLQLVDARAQQTQLTVEVESLTREVEELRQRSAAAGEENQSLAAKLQTVLDEYTEARRTSRAQVDALNARLAGLEPQLAAAEQQVRNLETSLTETAYKLESSDKRIRTLERRLKESESENQALNAARLLQRRRQARWAKAAIVLLVLLGIVAGAVGLRERYIRDDAGEQAVAARKPALPADRLAEAGAGPTGEALDASSRAAARSPEARVTAPLPKPLPQPISAGKPDRPESSTKQSRPKSPIERLPASRPGSGTHSQAYLMQADAASGSGDGQRERISRPAIIELPSGVKYSVIKNGTGRSPKPGDTVAIVYQGTLPDGTRLGDGEANGAETLRISDAIPGLRDVLQYMEEGAKWEVFIPGDLSFKKPGPFGARDVVFVIELAAVGVPGVKDIEAVRHRGEDFIHSGAPSAGPESDSDTAGAAQQADPPVAKSRAGVHAFFAENAKNKGVVSLPSGLQYKVLKAGNGSGRKPGADDRVSLRYRGMLPDGREFDSSDSSGGEVSVAVKDVIPGWREALLQMEEGATWQLYIPPSLATRRNAVRKRGAMGLQPVIYDIELVSIQ